MKTVLPSLAVALTCLTFSVAAAAAPIVVDFDSLAELDGVTNQFPGLTFQNATVLTAGSTLNEYELPPRSGLNVAFDDFGPMRVDFGLPVLSFGAYFTYLLPLTMSAYDSSDALLGSVVTAFGSNQLVSGDSGSAPNEFLQLAIPGMAYVVVSGDAGGGSFVVDDVTIRSVEMTPVPEPATVGFVMFGLAGLAARRIFRARCG